MIKSFRSHAATVNDISIDKSDEFVASASDDGNPHWHTCHLHALSFTHSLFLQARFSFMRFIHPKSNHSTTRDL